MPTQKPAPTPAAPPRLTTLTSDGSPGLSVQDLQSLIAILQAAVQVLQGTATNPLAPVAQSLSIFTNAGDQTLNTTKISAFMENWKKARHSLAINSSFLGTYSEHTIAKLAASKLDAKTAKALGIDTPLVYCVGNLLINKTS